MHHSEDPCQDLNDDVDMKLPDHVELMDAFLAGLSKESENDFSSLSLLLATLPYQSCSHAEVEAVSSTQATELGLIPDASNETLRAFSYSEMKLCKYAMTYKWTVEEFIDTIKLIKSTDFKVEDVNTDLHKSVQAAMAKGYLHKSHHAGRSP
jgi:hypothetical protein